MRVCILDCICIVVTYSLECPFFVVEAYKYFLGVGSNLFVEQIRK